MTETKQYAYGKDEVDGACCPTQAVGRSPSESAEMLEIVGRYDRQVRERFNEGMGSSGTVDASVARAAWHEALDDLRGQVGYEEPFEIGEQIAEKLGWLDD